MAAITGMPAGVIGVRASAMPAPSSAAASASRLAQQRGEQRQEQRGEGGVEAERGRVGRASRRPRTPIAVPRVPARVEAEARTDQDAPVEVAVALRERPALVDQQLRLEQPAQPAAPEDAWTADSAIGP